MRDNCSLNMKERLKWVYEMLGFKLSQADGKEGNTEENEIEVLDKLTLTAKNRSEIELYGNPEIDLL